MNPDVYTCRNKVTEEPSEQFVDGHYKITIFFLVFQDRISFYKFYFIYCF